MSNETDTLTAAEPLSGETNAVPAQLKESVAANTVAEVENPDDRPHMGGWQKRRLLEVANALHAGEVVQPATVRVFLSWFWYTQRRGKWITSYIRERLGDAGLVTVPDFESTYLDAEITFELAPDPVDVEGERTEEIAQALKVSDHSEIKIAPAAFGDPTYRISKLAAANRVPTSVKPDSSLTEAITLMMTNDFSQLPVMVSDREVKGMVSWNSIGTRLVLGQAPQWVREVMDPHAEISSDASLFAAIPVIVEQGYALVRSNSDKRVVGIITTSDLSLQFQQLSEPFLLLGEIENHIRRIINMRFSKADLIAAKDGTDTARSVESVSDLTFGEYKRLLEEPSRWAALQLDLDRGVFIQLLERVRVIRNEVMHFDPDGIEDESLSKLRDFARFLRTLQTIGAT